MTHANRQHKVLRILSALVLFVCIHLPDAAGANDDVAKSWVTRSGYYIVSFESELQPVAINRIHQWVFHIEDRNGNPLDGASITLTGGMPEHNHGLPTSPRMTAALGDGDYLVEGMRFHMNGLWEITVTVSVDGRRDTAVIAVTI